MNNKLIDIHNNLMCTLEDLDDEKLLEDPEQLEKICKIAKAKATIAREIINVDRLGFDAVNSGAVAIMNNNVLRID